MNNFTKIVFGSCVGFVVASIAISALGFLFILGLGASGGNQKTTVSSNSVLHLTFDQPVPEQTNNLEMDPFKLDQDVLGLYDMQRAIEHAAEDENISGIYINIENGVMMGMAQSSSIREALNNFKESGKFIVSYSKSYSQGAYYLASVSDEIYVNPMGGVDFRGFSATIPFFKGMLDKIGVRMQVFYAGDFKSATEPYRLTEMSDSNRLQLRQYLDPAFANMLREVSESRGKSSNYFRDLAAGLKIQTPNDAVKLGVVDKVGYLDDVLASMREKMGLEEDDKIKTVSIEDYADSYTPEKGKGKDRVAVIFAEGTILHTDGERGSIVDDKYVKMIRKIRQSEKIKAIVLRVNSPGGSAIASENIWRELTLAQEAGKPVVVSMGTYAASGGYYISCMADKIYAEENTLTGSIGVFQMIPHMGELFEDKLGITFDTVKTTEYAVGLNTIYDMSEGEQEFMQANTNHVYDVFLNRVAEGRNMPYDEVAKIAKGRVYIGDRAKEIGLVDEIGDLDDAIASAVELAGLEEYRTKEYPIQPDPMTEFINELTGQSDDDAIKTALIQKEMGKHYNLYKHLKEMVTMQGAQAKLPVLVNFN